MSYDMMWYVLFIGLTGYSSDDINKFLWPVRIGSGVFPNDMPGERDFYAGGNFDIGPGGAPALLNCVAYKCCYYKFGMLEYIIFLYNTSFHFYNYPFPPSPL